MAKGKKTAAKSATVRYASKFCEEIMHSVIAKKIGESDGSVIYIMLLNFITN